MLPGRIVSKLGAAAPAPAAEHLDHAGDMEWSSAEAVCPFTECQNYEAIVPCGCQLLVGHCSNSTVPGCAQAAITLLLEGHVPTMEAAQAFLVNSDPPQIDIAEELARLGIYKVLSQLAISELGCS